MDDAKAHDDEHGPHTPDQLADHFVIPVSSSPTDGSGGPPSTVFTVQGRRIAVLNDPASVSLYSSCRDWVKNDPLGMVPKATEAPAPSGLPPPFPYTEGTRLKMTPQPREMNKDELFQKTPQHTRKALLDSHVSYHRDLKRWYRSRHLYRLWRYHDRLLRFNIHVPELTVAGPGQVVVASASGPTAAGSGSFMDVSGGDATQFLSGLGLSTPPRVGGGQSDLPFLNTPGLGGLAPPNIDFGLTPPRNANGSGFDVSDLTAAGLAEMAEDGDPAMVLASIATSPPRPTRQPYLPPHP